MAFFRIKKIKNKEYVYLVENSWKRKGSRQKVRSYIGKAYRFEFKNNIGFLEYKNIDNMQAYTASNTKTRIVQDLMEWEFFKFGINKNDFEIDFEKFDVSKNGKKAVLMINDGYMCSLTLKNLIDFKPEGDEQQDGYGLARAFVEAGIKVPQEVFVALFGKIYNAQQS